MHDAFALMQAVMSDLRNVIAVGRRHVFHSTQFRASGSGYRINVRLFLPTVVNPYSVLLTSKGIIHNWDSADPGGNLSPVVPWGGGKSDLPLPQSSSS